MTKSEIIAEHTRTVQSRNKLQKQGDLDTQYAAMVEKKISVMGQIHNPRISAKSRVALNLN